VVDEGTSWSDVVTTAGSVPALVEGPACTNCGEGPVGRFCAACGQRHLTGNDFTAKEVLRETLNEFISVDGRFWLTLWTLVRHPGKLAREYFDGRGARYMRPLNLFLLLNLVFFLVQPHTGLLQWHLQGYLGAFSNARTLVEQKRLERATEIAKAQVAQGGKPSAPRLEPMEVFEAEFEGAIQNLKKSMLLVAIPLFALVLGACYGRRRRFAEHLVFSTHFYAFTVFSLTTLVPLCFIAMVGWMQLLHVPKTSYQMLGGEIALTCVLFVLLGGYLYVGLRRMYGDPPTVAAGRALVLFGAYHAMVIVFSISMFRITLWAM
jgi:hypothetical protein